MCRNTLKLLSLAQAFFDLNSGKHVSFYRGIMPQHGHPTNALLNVVHFVGSHASVLKPWLRLGNDTARIIVTAASIEKGRVFQGPHKEPDNRL
jgi:hypothetical protein